MVTLGGEQLALDDRDEHEYVEHKHMSLLSYQTLTFILDMCGLARRQ
jgi:hypothetical protein